MKARRGDYQFKVLEKASSQLPVVTEETQIALQAALEGEDQRFRRLEVRRLKLDPPVGEHLLAADPEPKRVGVRASGLEFFEQRPHLR